MKRLSVPAFPCCPVSTQPFGDLLLMWKLAQPQCSFMLDFCFVNTSYVVGDMTWTSYLSPSPSRNYTGSLVPFQSGYNEVPKAQCLFFSYCWWELASEGKIEGGCSPISPQHHLPSKSTVAVQSCAETLGGYREHPVLRRLCLYGTWVSHAEKALQEPSPEVLVLMLCREMCLCPVAQMLCSWRLLIFFLVEMQKRQPWNRDIRFFVVTVSTSVVAPGFTALPLISVTAWASERAWDLLVHWQQTSNTAVSCFLRNNASANIQRCIWKDKFISEIDNNMFLLPTLLSSRLSLVWT